MSQDEVPLYQEVLSSFNAEAPTLAPAYTQSVLKESATQTIEIPGALSLLANNISDSESEDAPRVSTENRAIEQPDSRTTSDAVTQKEQLVDSNAGGYCTDEQSVEGDQDNGQLSSELAPPQSNSSWQQLDIGIKNTPKRNLRNLGEATKVCVPKFPGNFLFELTHHNLSEYCRSIRSTIVANHECWISTLL